MHKPGSSQPPNRELASALRPIVTERLGALCDLAVAQAAAETDRELMLGDTTVAAALTRAVTVIVPQPDNLAAIVDSLPQRPDLILGPLTDQLATYYRRLAGARAS
jgi:hypothetical protein